ncbi:MAG: hypothetical protein ACI92E_000412 [Oceanicoccus sp.]|jgi:hypothetical protein
MYFYNYRIIELSNYRIIELSNYRIIELSNYRIIELSSVCRHARDNRYRADSVKWPATEGLFLHF